MILIYESDFVKIWIKNSNFANNTIFSSEKTVFVFEGKSVLADKYVEFNSYRFDFDDYSHLEIDLTDIILSSDYIVNLNFKLISTVHGYFVEENINLSFNVKSGIFPRVNEFPPFEIPHDKVKDFLISFNIIPDDVETYEIQQYLNGQWVAIFNEINGQFQLELFDGFTDDTFAGLYQLVDPTLNPKIDVSSFDTTFDGSFRTPLDVNNSKFRFIFKELDCNKEYILLKWKDKGGNFKNWWFEVQNTEFLTNKNISLENNTDSYNVLKNKMIDKYVIHRKADYLTRKYISDIIFSDEVFIYDEFAPDNYRQINIKEQNLKISEKRKDNLDIILTLNVNKYDTI